MCSLPSNTIHTDVLTRQVLSAFCLIFSLSCATLIFTLLMLIFQNVCVACETKKLKNIFWCSEDHVDIIASFLCFHLCPCLSHGLSAGLHKNSSTDFHDTWMDDGPQWLRVDTINIWCRSE